MLFRSKTYDALVSLKEIFHYHFINAQAPLELVQDNIIRELEELGLVSGERTHRKSRGSPPMSLTLNPQGAYAIGVNVTPRGIEVHPLHQTRAKRRRRPARTAAGSGRAPRRGYLAGDPSGGGREGALFAVVARADAAGNQDVCAESL